jgi:transposase-like protein
MERANKEIKRHIDDVGVFPHPSALLLLAGAALVEQHVSGMLATDAPSPNPPCSS